MMYYSLQELAATRAHALLIRALARGRSGIDQITTAMRIYSYIATDFHNII